MNTYNISEISSMVFKNYPRKLVVIISVAEMVQALIQEVKQKNL